MIDFYIMWTYQANYSERPMKIRAHNAKDAIKNFTSFYSDDFKNKATVYAFTEPPVSMWKNGILVNNMESNF